MRSATRLKVLHLGKFYPPHKGGIETVLQVLCEGLSPLMDVSAVVANDGPVRSVEDHPGLRLRREAAWLELASTPICPGMLAGIRAGAYDLIHLHLPNPMAAIALLASGSRAPLIVSYHSDIIRQKFLGALFAPLLHRLLRRCAAVIVATQEYLDSSPVLPSYRDRCRVIPYGIRLEPFLKPRPAEAAEIKKRHGPRIILSAGRLVYYKGLEHLIDAMASIEAKLLIAGEGPLRAALEARAQASPAAARVTFLGDVHDLAPYYQAADVFVLPSTQRSEAFGIVQVEAMASGAPVVNTRISSGAPWVSPHEVTGLTVPPADPRALAQAVNSLLGDPARRRAYGEAGRRRAQELFGAAAMVGRVADLYAEVLGRPLPTP